MTDIPTDTPSPPKRACIYIRVSTEEQGTRGHGASAQQLEMLRWAEYHGYIVKKQHIFSDIGYSGASEIEDREALPRLFECARNKEFDVVLVWKVDRFFRKTLYLLDAIERLEQIGIGFISTTQSEINTTSTMGKFLLSLLGIIAEMERNNILERTASGKKACAIAGKWAGGKNPPYGYIIDKNKRMVADEEESKVIRRIFDWFVNDKLPISSIQKRLTSAGIMTKADTKDADLKERGVLNNGARTLNPACFWHFSHIYSILHQECYTGTYHYGKKTSKKDPKTRKRIEVENPKEKWIPITCPQILDKEMFFKAQAIFEEHRKESKNQDRDYLLSGKVYCGCCGGQYVAYTQKKHKIIDGERVLKGEYAMYRCSRGNAWKASTTCSNRQISGKILEPWVWSQVEELFQDPKSFIEKLDFRKKDKDNSKKMEEEKEQLEQMKSDLIKEKERVFQIYERGLKYQGEGELEARTKEIDFQIEKTSEHIDRLCLQLLSKEAEKERLETAKKLAKKWEHYVDGDTEMKSNIVKTGAF